MNVILPDDRQVTKHGEAVSEYTHFRAGLIRPIYRNFSNAVASLLSQIEQFQVEPESIDRGVAEQFLSDAAAKQFKTALGV